jgi:hypothetical protein
MPFSSKNDRELYQRGTVEMPANVFRAYCKALRPLLVDSSVIEEQRSHFQRTR